MKMIPCTKKTVQQAIDLHKKWLNNEPDGKRLDVSNKIVKFDFKLSDFSSFKDVNFSGADFSDAYFIGTNFNGTNFSGADFSGADFSNTYFIDTDFHDANFNGAYFIHTNFSNADFKDTDFNGADFNGTHFNGTNFSNTHFDNTNFHDAHFHGTDFSNVDFRNTYFNNADFNGADFFRTYFCNTDFNGAHFNSTDFSGINFSDADFNNTAIDWNCIFKNADECTAFLNLQCPEAGSFIAYKMARNCLIKLEIPADALRSSATTRKCRASKAKVLEIADENGKKIKSTCSDRTSQFIYEVGKTVYSRDDDGNIAFDENRWNECSTGIHFFITKQEAINYNRFN